MEKLLLDCILELSGAAGMLDGGRQRIQVDNWLACQTIVTLPEQLAAKLLAKGVQLPPNHGMIDITHLLD